jgi:hypothetical protein
MHFELSFDCFWVLRIYVLGHFTLRDLGLSNSILSSSDVLDIALGTLLALLGL